MSIVYFWTAIAKIDPVWLEGRLLPRLVSPHANHLVASVAALLAPGNEAWLVSTIWRSLSVFVCIFEFVLVVLLFFPTKRMKWFLFPVGVGLHLGMEVSGLQIGRFSYFMMLLYLPLLPSTFVRWLCSLLATLRAAERALESRLFGDTWSHSYDWLGFLLSFIGGNLLVWYCLPFPAAVVLPALAVVSFLTLVTVISTEPSAAIDNETKGMKKKGKRNKRKKGVRGQAVTYGRARKGFAFLLCCMTIVLLEVSTMQYREFQKGLAHSYIAVGNWDEGIAHYETLIAHHFQKTSGRATLLAELGVFLETRNRPGDDEKAVGCYQEALSIDGENIFALFGMMPHHLKKKHKEEVCRLSDQLAAKAKEVVRVGCGYWDASLCESRKRFAENTLAKGIPQTRRQAGCA